MKTMKTHIALTDKTRKKCMKANLKMYIHMHTRLIVFKEEFTLF